MVKIKDSSSNDVAEYAYCTLGKDVGMHMGRMPMPRVYDALGQRIRMIDKAGEEPGHGDGCGALACRARGCCEGGDCLASLAMTMLRSQ